MENRTECTLIKFMDGTKLRGVDDKLCGCAAFHLDWLKNWAERNIMKLDKRKYQFLHLRRNNLAISVNAWTDDAKRTQPSSFQGCPSTGWEAMNTNRNSGGSISTHDKTFLLWKWLNTGTNFPERYWEFFVLRDLKLDGTQPQEIFGWPCFEQGNWRKSSPNCILIVH